MSLSFFSSLLLETNVRNYSKDNNRWPLIESYVLSRYILLNVRMVRPWYGYVSVRSVALCHDDTSNVGMDISIGEEKAGDPEDIFVQVKLWKFNVIVA